MEGDDRCQQCFHSLMQRDIPRSRRGDEIQKALLTRPVSDLLTGKDLLVCRPEDTLDKIARLFINEGKNCVLVYKQKKMVGILSNRDILFKAGGEGVDLSQVLVGDIMTPRPGYVRPDDPIAYAVNKMAMGGYRHVPVLREDGTPVSILIIIDVLKFLSRSKTSY